MGGALDTGSSPSLSLSELSDEDEELFPAEASFGFFRLGGRIGSGVGFADWMGLISLVSSTPKTGMDDIAMCCEGAR